MIIIYFDKNLKKEEENINNFIKLRETFYGNEVYGVDTLDKFKYLISLFGKLNSYYYLITSGGGAEEFLNSGYYEENRIINFVIYCFNKNKYLPLMQKYKRISMIENESFDNVIEHLKESFPECLSKEKDILKHCSSFLLEKEYKGTPLQIHQKMAEYFDDKFDTPAFDEKIKEKILNTLNKIAQQKSDYEKAKEILDEIKDENDLIKCYTAESIIVYFINKCLREVDKNCIEFAGLLNYALFKYYFENPSININEDTIFYRKLALSIKDLYAYDLFEGSIICFPSFTSTSIDIDAFKDPDIKPVRLSSFGKKMIPFGKQVFPFGKSDDNEKEIFTKEKCVLMKFNYKYNDLNYCPCFNIIKASEFSSEKEFLFPPFSFFKITKYISAKGDENDPIIIELEVIPKRENLEQYLKIGGFVYYDKDENIMNYDF